MVAIFLSFNALAEPVFVNYDTDFVDVSLSV